MLSCRRARLGNCLLRASSAYSSRRTRLARMCQWAALPRRHTSRHLLQSKPCEVMEININKPLRLIKRGRRVRGFKDGEIERRRGKVSSQQHKSKACGWHRHGRRAV